MSTSALQKLLLLLSLIYPSAIKGQECSEDWSYENPESWSEQYQYCNGNRQSPIRLQVRESLIFPIAPIIFRNYDTALKGNVSLANNGHSVELKVTVTTNGQPPFLYGGILRGRYEALNVHFHWGSRTTKGAEHVIDGIRYDAEMHIVHKNMIYSSLEEASRHKDGLAVLGVMLKIVEEPYVIHPGLYKVFSQLQNVVDYQSSANITYRLTLGEMLGDLNTKRFFTYVGSLTTPNCAEAVTWIVFPEALPVSRKQMQKLWSIKNEKGNVLINNFRPLQNRNTRPVFYFRINYS